MFRWTIYAGTDPLASRDRVARLRGFLIEALEANAIFGATIVAAEGIWLGEREPTFRVEIIGRSREGRRIKDAAYHYAQTADQDEVWIVRERIAVEKVRALEPVDISDAPWIEHG